MKATSFGITDIGKKRRINQDAYLCDDELRLYIIADGMGGHLGGEVASQLAVEVIRKYCSENQKMDPTEVLRNAINKACEAIFKKSQENEELSGMGTTCSVLLLRDRTVYIAQVGDSRAYLLNGGNIWQMTEDHSLVNEEIRSGRIVPGQIESFQFRNVITRSVGYEPQVEADIYHRPLQPGDRFLVCTDGLSGMVSGREIMENLENHGPEKGLRSLVDLANNRGGDDNITALVCYFEEIDSPDSTGVGTNS